MEFLLYFTIGILVTFVGALPLGTVNISVINTTLKVDMRNAMKIAFAAGIAEILLSFYALHSSMMIAEFIEMNSWIQVTIAIILFVAGGFLFFKKQKTTAEKKFKMPKYVTGLLLGLLNPPVLAYWLFMISYLNKNDFHLNMNSSIAILIVFFLGVYLGKLATLYGYSRFSVFLKNKVQNIAVMINRVIGVLLLVIGCVQLVKFLLG
ncbi:MAG: LysE family transporter [Bacteroidota bacterium]